MQFSNDDAFCVTTGGSDKCVFVWATDIIEEKRAREALLQGAGVWLASAPTHGHGAAEEESFLPFKPPPLTGGDESMAIKVRGVCGVCVVCGVVWYVWCVWCVWYGVVCGVCGVCGVVCVVWCGVVWRGVVCVVWWCVWCVWCVVWCVLCGV